MPLDQAGFVIPRRLSHRERQLEVLKAARDTINTNPELWIKGSYGKGPGHCVVGWLRHYSSRFRGNQIAVHALVPVLPVQYQKRLREFPDSVRTVVQAFNDDNRTTHADVVNLFDEAITRLETM